MAQARKPLPVIPIVAVISRYAEAREWGMQQLTDRLGGIEYRSDPQPFEASGYYEAEMGTGLEKQFVAFAPVTDPGALADWKLWTNSLEASIAEEAEALFGSSVADSDLRFGGEPRPLNLDCGYVTEAKFVLATTKDRDHRLYLRDGIYAEVTLSYMRRSWHAHRWTYPDYQTDLALAFAERCRLQLRAYLADYRLGSNDPEDASSR